MELWTQLKDIADWAERQKVASFIGSSLLVVYEPDDGAVVTTTTAVVGDGDGSGVQELQRKVVVKLIDFAHSTVHAQGEGDDNFSTGLRNLYGYVTQLVELSAQLDTSHVSVDHVCEAMFKLPPPMPVASATPAVLLG
ncbi:inositol polyphosphate kinase-domain-containing protein [Tribonema minus]|uniref:Kinase n=1 Tax=Tribonema minus TaxID=303371 RepID=A0A835ZAL6_9STRA|nr:inositol polyphosphate kinase-domain-containing protein [Tribonema minus]